MKDAWLKRIKRVRILLPACYYEAVWNALRDKRAFCKIRHVADGSISLNLSLSLWQTLQREQRAFITEAVVTEIGPFPVLLRHRRRVGLLLGALFAVGLFWLSTNRLWDIRITGNEFLSDKQITEELQQAGLTIGRSLSTIEARAIAEDVLLRSEKLSYISIHMRGNVAYVQVIERKAGENAEQLPDPCNLTATDDAVIESLAVKRGTVMVKPGQVVKKGQLLVSGIEEGSEGSRFFAAQGEVYGRVKREFSVTIPLHEPPINGMTQAPVEFSLILWGKRINIYANTGNLPPTYDTIYEREWIYLGKDTPLPFGYARTVAAWPRQDEGLLSSESIVTLAYRRMQQQLTQALSDGELLNKKTYGEFTEEAYILRCEAECLINIAQRKEFEAAQ